MRIEPMNAPAVLTGRDGPFNVLQLKLRSRVALLMGALCLCSVAGAQGKHRYRSQDSLPELEARWAASGIAHSLNLGESYGGRRMVAIEVGAAGTIPVSERPVVLLIGAPNGVSLAGSEAVLTILDFLTAQPAGLPTDVAFLAIPFANPDGSAKRANGLGFGANDRPVDDDGDGRVDEDGADDLSGEGLTLEMLLEDEHGDWVRSDDGRALRRAAPGEAPRFLRLPEGKDNDQDGLFNEDGPGGVVTDRNFPVGWTGAWDVRGAGELPLSEPSSRALVQLIAGRRVALALVFQGAHGTLVRPGSVPDLPSVAADESLWRELGRAFVTTTKRELPIGGQLPRLDQANEHPMGGSLTDWLYYAKGIPALEVAPWGLCVTKVSGDVKAREGTFEAALQPVDPDRVEEERWCAWLDETRGGIGFLEWEPIQLDDGRAGFVGGWEPRTRHDPPESDLDCALAGLPEFVLAAAKALPHYEFEVRSVRHEDAVFELQVRVRNHGRIPSHAGPRRLGAGDAQLVVTLSTGADAKLLAGQTQVQLGQLAGGELSHSMSWLIAAPEGTPLQLSLSGPGLVPVTKEVRP